MKILVLNGSPHVNGATAHMVNALCEGAKEAGHETEVIPVAHKKINGCLGCEYCHGKGNGECVQKDDMGEMWLCFMAHFALIRDYIFWEKQSKALTRLRN